MKPKFNVICAALTLVLGGVSLDTIENDEVRSQCEEILSARECAINDMKA